MIKVISNVLSRKAIKRKKGLFCGESLGWATLAVTWANADGTEHGLLQMQHLFVGLQGTFGDPSGGINKDCKQ